LFVGEKQVNEASETNLVKAKGERAVAPPPLNPPLAAASRIDTEVDRTQGAAEKVRPVLLALPGQTYYVFAPGLFAKFWSFIWLIFFRVCASTIIDCPLIIGSARLFKPNRTHSGQAFATDGMVRRSISLSITRLRCAKTAEQIEVLFEVKTLGHSRHSRC